MDPAVFYSSFTLLALHVWLVVHRLAAENDRDGRFFKQRFYNHFQVHGLDKGGLHVRTEPYGSSRLVRLSRNRPDVHML
jgi:hypothetical protein